MSDVKSEPAVGYGGLPPQLATGPQAPELLAQSLQRAVHATAEFIQSRVSHDVSPLTVPLFTCVILMR